MALAAWLLLTNLSLGLYHQHEAEEGASVPAAPHQAAPEARHYHILLLGVELDFLSLNADSCPFGPDTDREGESHVLLASLLAPGAEQDPGLGDALLLACDSFLHVPDRYSSSEDLSQSLAATARELTGLPPSEVALGARSGVQQI